MILTLSEAQLYCQKALCAAGAAPGIDEEGGYAAAWLEARGLPAFGALAEALACWTGDANASRLATPDAPDDGENLEAEGRSAVFLGRVLIDLCVAAAARSEAPPTITVRDLAHPQFLLPHAVDCQRQGLSLALAWTDSAEACRDQTAIGQAVVDRDQGLALHGDGWTNQAPERTVTALLSCYGQSGDGRPPPPALPLRHSAADLETRFRASLSGGLAVEDGLWDCIAGMAAQTHVPATEESRLRGAGSSASDNE